jgi:hypothetical protein
VASGDAGVVWRIRRQLDAVLPDGLGAFEVSSIALPEDPDDYVTPDLIVLPTEWMEDDDWLAVPEDAALAVEVISQAEKSREIRDKADWYAVARVPVLLVVDPRNGTWALHSRPGKGAYGTYCLASSGNPCDCPSPCVWRSPQTASRCTALRRAGGGRAGREPRRETGRGV